MTEEKSIDDTPIFRDVFKEVTMNFIMSHSIHADELSIILKGHLFTEYMLDMLIREKFEKPNTILKYKFSQKLEILYSLDLLPLYLYKNISYLNKIRNRFAHNLEYDLSNEKLTFYTSDGKKVDVANGNLKRKSLRIKIRTFCIGVLDQLNYHYIANLKFPPIFK